ncbi:redoxin domain-containing protein [Lewinella cohaerens]|uniref:redoxin domain-containing protein n=1 Tax=Lewinella cohaerens TaxID=70995 RepID=UPI00035C500E|nr:redoxin domain-containing protein [Lewinella cohaerens]
MQIEGSVDNQLLYDNLRYETTYQAALSPLSQQLKTLTEGTPEYTTVEKQRQQLIADRKSYLDEVFATYPTSFFVKFKQAGQNPELRRELPNDAQVTAYRMEFWDNVDFSDERLMNTPVIFNKIKRYFEELTPQQPDSIILSLERLVERLPTLENSEYYKYFVNYVALNYEPTKTTLMDSEAVFVHMVQNHFTYERAFWSDSTNVYALQLRADEMANSLVGQPGPNVKARDEKGQEQSIYDLKAPYIVVYLYNPDCEHCQEQSPVLVDLYRGWQQQTPALVDVYAIAIDTEDALWKDYISKTGMRWTNVFDPSNKAIYKTYYVNVTPEVYLLGPDRKIIAKNLNVSQINDVIARDQQKR